MKLFFLTALHGDGFFFLFDVKGFQTFLEGGGFIDCNDYFSRILYLPKVYSSEPGRSHLQGDVWEKESRWQKCCGAGGGCP